MRLRGIIWLPAILEKLADKHDVSDEEVEFVLENAPFFRKVQRGRVKGEHVYAAFGQTEAGRYLIVFFILKRNGMALIISARDMDETERKHYENR